MQQVQIYIEGQRVEMFDYESVVITDSIKDVRDVSKIFTEYSQTFSLPASRINNKVFKHYYNSDISDGFDSRIRVPAKLELNSMPFKNGYIKLEGVDLRDNKAHTYRITFFGNTVSLKDLLGDDLLSSLTWLSNFNLDYTPTNIETYLTTSTNKIVDSVNYIKPIQVPLITHSQRLYYDSTQGHAHEDNHSGNVYYESGSGHEHGVKWNELKYAIRLEIIIKAIEKKYTIANGYSQNLVFSDDFFDLNTNNDFSELYMWLHRVKGKVTNGGQLDTFSYIVDGFDDADNQQSSITNNVLHLKSFGQVDSSANSLRLNMTPVQDTTYSFSVLRDGLSVYSSGDISGDVRNIDIPVVINSDYTIQINITESISFSNISWNYSYFDSDSQSFVNETYLTNSTIAIPETFEFDITQQIPKMKVLDFLTAIFKMFNLVAYVDGTEIIVKTLDSYYSDGVNYNITKYIDVSESQTNSVLPFREIIFGYEGLGSFLANRHNELFNEDWGTEEYKTENSSIFTGGIYQYKIPFEHMKFERLIDLNESNTNPTFPTTNIQWGYCVDSKQDAYIGKPIVFYMALKTQEISFIDSTDPIDNTPDSHKPIQTYFVPANSNLIFPNLEDRQSINFSPESDEWELTPNMRSLFNQYHSNYISGIFNKTNRLTKMSAYLPLNILLKYTLADRLQVAGRSYKINSIETDFRTGKSQLELLSDYAPSVIDLVPPTAPTNLALVQGSQTSSGFEVTWTASTDNVGVTGYIIDLNQDFYTTIGNVTTYTFTGLQGGTTYVVGVYATDAAGNVSPISNIINVTTPQ